MFEELLTKLGKTLKRYHIPYMIIGGQAVLLYGDPRLTKDIDITLGTGTEALDELLKVIKEIPLQPIPENIIDFVNRTMVLPAIHKETGIRVDFIFSFTPYEHQAIERAVKVSIGNEEIAFASPEDLVIHKIFSGRPRDLEDVKGVLLKNSRIDINYIEKWLREFDCALQGENFLDKFRKLLHEVKDSASRGI